MAEPYLISESAEPVTLTAHLQGGKRLNLPWNAYLNCLFIAPGLSIIFRTHKIEILLSGYEPEKEDSTDTADEVDFDALWKAIEGHRLAKIYNRPKEGCNVKAYAMEADPEGNPTWVEV